MQLAHDVRYTAFISYSHSDRRRAAWLHRTLERYRPPRELDGSSVSLRPIFRDRADLPAGPDLGEAIRNALDRSAHLVILCSPAALGSHWVSQELGYFLQSHPVDDVFCVIVSGPTPEASVLDCLPPALRAALPPGSEPLAIDLRPGRDGPRLGRLKLAAGLLGVGLDQLVQRDARLRLRWMAGIAVAALLLSASLAVATFTAIDARQQAQRRSAESEDLIAFMLGDLRSKLEPVGRLDVLDGVGRKVLAHYETMDRDRLDDAALAQQAKALTLLGAIRIKRADLPGAEQAFARAVGTSAALSAHAPRDGDRLFDHAQNVYWLAFVQWRLDHVAAAERGFAEYARLADRLVAIDPTRADWQTEPAYARSNLGTLLLEQGRTEEALNAFEAARVVFEAASRAAPADPGRLGDLVDAQNWVADALFRLGRLQPAYRARSAAAKLLSDRVASAPDNRPLEAQALSADLALARRALDIGRVAEASDLVARSTAGLKRLEAFDPANAEWGQYAMAADLETVDLALVDGTTMRAQAAHREAGVRLAHLKALGGAAYRWRPQLEGRWERQTIDLARQSGASTAMRSGASAAMRPAATLLLQHAVAPGQKEPGERAMLAGYADLALGRAADALRSLVANQAVLSPEGRDLLARTLLTQGDSARAAQIVQALYRSGYRHPAFVGFWSNHGLSIGNQTKGE